MSRREFRLQAVLRARKRALDSAQGTLARELRAQNREMQEQADLLGKIRETSSDLDARLAIGTSAALVRAVGGAIEATRRRAKSAAMRVGARDVSIARARAAIVTARKNLRGLEILEANWRSVRRLEHAKRDQNRIDEVATRIRGGINS